MDLCDQLCWSARLSLRLPWQKLNIGHYMENFQQISCMPAMLVGTIDL